MKERKERVLIFISAVFIEFFNNTNAVILTRDQEGQRLDSSGPILDIIGQKQCVRECMRRGDCLSVNYWKRDLRCQLNPSTVGLGAVLIQDVNCVYMERASQPQELLTGPCVSTTCPFRCTYLSNGGTFCGPDINDAVVTTSETNCPSNYRWVPSVNLCYILFESTRTWQDSKSLCEGAGARLALLDTPMKLTAMRNEFDSGAVTSLTYYIGASFNNTLMGWKWINGFSVDPYLLSLYSIPSVPDTCLTWNHLATFQECPCSLKYPYLCEIPT